MSKKLICGLLVMSCLAVLSAVAPAAHARTPTKMKAYDKYVFPGQNVTFKGKLRTRSGTPLNNKLVKFYARMVVNGGFVWVYAGSDRTNSHGNAYKSVKIPGNTPPGNYKYNAVFHGDASYGSSADQGNVLVLRYETGP